LTRCAGQWHPALTARSLGTARRHVPYRSLTSRMRTPIAIAVVEYDGRYLVGRRPLGVPLAGLWEFPGGKVLPCESPRVAAARECLEETGLAVDVGDEYPVVAHDYAHDRVELHFFACRVIDTARLPREPFCWVAAEELADLR